MSNGPWNVGCVGADIPLIVWDTTYLERGDSVWWYTIVRTTSIERYRLECECSAFLEYVSAMCHQTKVEGMFRLTRLTLLGVNDRDREKSCEGNERPR
jgi:hypothetical protein